MRFSRGNQNAVPIRVACEITDRWVGEIIDDMLYNYGFTIYNHVGYFSIQEEGRALEYISYVDLVGLTLRLLSRTLKQPNLSTGVKLRLKQSYKNLKNYEVGLHNKQKNPVCLKCATNGASIHRISPSTGERTLVFTCPHCMQSLVGIKIKPYKSIRGL